MTENRRILAAAAAQADGWTQIAVCGRFVDEDGGFEITEGMVDSWQRNLHAGAVTGRPEVAVDYEHAMDPVDLTDRSRRGTQMRASGWIRDIKRVGYRVLAKIEWTPAAQRSISDGEFRYFSPTYAENYRDQQGRNVGDVLLGGGLTNRPFLRQGMRPVTLSQLELEAERSHQVHADRTYCLGCGYKVASCACGS